MSGLAVSTSQGFRHLALVPELQQLADFANYVEQQSKPSSGEFDNECLAKDRAKACRK